MNGKKQKTWPLGPFKRIVDQPVIEPNADVVFDCPMKKKPVYWAARHTFNPAATVHQDKIHVLFRAEEGETDQQIGEYTSRIGHAISADGITFEIQPKPLIYPAEDDWRGDEWYGGCEDPRIVESEAGVFALYYTMWNRNNPKDKKKTAKIGVATSRDLKVWTKHGPIFAQPNGLMQPDVPEWHKACGVVQTKENGRLVATKIHGKYWMYWGENAIRVATSTDLIHWHPVLDDDGEIMKVISPRKNHFDSQFTEVGPSPVLTEQGIVLIYNGKNALKPENAEPDIDLGAYSAGQVLFDAEDPTKVLGRLDKPFLKPELDFERTGQYKQGTIFTEGLVLFHNTWYLYYGAADSKVGVATAPSI